MTKRILVVEDDPDVATFEKDLIKHMGYDVWIARDGIEGLNKARVEKPDLVILDIMLPKMDGHEVCRKIKTDPDTRHIPILMVTALGQPQDLVYGLDIGADDYLTKPYHQAVFEATVKKLLKRSSAPPFKNQPGDNTIIIECIPKHRIHIRANGLTSQTKVCKNIFDINTDDYAYYGDNIYLHNWRYESKHIGKQLYQEIFKNHYEVFECYNIKRGEVVSQRRKLHLCFESTGEFIRVPLECLSDDMNNNGEYLALQYPLVRSITNVPTKQPLSPSFLNELSAKSEPLKILLIASNTKPAIPGADAEIAILAKSIQEMFAESGVPVKVDVIPTKKATYQEVRKVLQNCQYHIVHYAGHGAFDNKSPEKSCLVFWEKQACQGTPIRMPVSELQILLKDSNLKFMYLSCCQSAKTGGEEQLLDDDFLSVMDGIVQAGVPSVLGFRWPVSDSGAKTLALAFYTSLAKQGQLDTALLDARCEVAAKNRDDITWLSPILVMQSYQI